MEKEMFQRRKFVKQNVVLPSCRCGLGLKFKSETNGGNPIRAANISPFDTQDTHLETYKRARFQFE